MVDPPWLPQVTGVSTESGPRLSRLPIEWNKDILILYAEEPCLSVHFVLRPE